MSETSKSDARDENAHTASQRPSLDAANEARRQRVAAGLSPTLDPVGADLKARQ